MEELRMKIICSATFDPWFNLALEEFLLTLVEENEVILYLWQNENTVVIGRNQNAWKECRCAELEAEGGKLARRLSGGGAVFHDLGNLNFTFLAHRRHYDVNRQLQVILHSVELLGLGAEFSGRNDLIINGRKFSGNAFYYDGDRMLHHGTVMIATDMTKLARYLQVPEDKIRSKGIESVRSRVVNLADVKPGVSVPAVKETIVQSFTEIYERVPEKLEVDLSSASLTKLYQKYSSWEWRYGRTPSFDVQFQHRFAWGAIDMSLNCKNGIILDAVIFSDAMDARLIQQMADGLKGRMFSLGAIKDAWAGLADGTSQEGIISDVLNWLATRPF